MNYIYLNQHCAQQIIEPNFNDDDFSEKLNDFIEKVKKGNLKFKMNNLLILFKIKL